MERGGGCRYSCTCIMNLRPPPPPMQIKNKFRDVCLRLGFSKPSLAENKHFQIFHTQIQTYEYSRVWINLIPSSTKIESWYFYTPLQWSAANNLPVLDIFFKNNVCVNVHIFYWMNILEYLDLGLLLRNKRFPPRYNCVSIFMEGRGSWYFDPYV